MLFNKLFGIILFMRILCACSIMRAQDANCKIFQEGIIKNPFLSKYLITAEAEYKGERFRIFTNRGDLKGLLNDANELTDEKTIFAVINGEKAVKLTDSNIYKQTIVRPWKEVQAVISKGKEYTLKTYFDENGGERVHLSDPEEAYLIDKIINWCVLVFEDDESGMIGLENVDNLKKYLENSEKK